jgi:hypothetical protein
MALIGDSSLHSSPQSMNPHTTLAYLPVLREAVLVAEDADSGDAQLRAGPHDARRNLPTVLCFRLFSISAMSLFDRAHGQRMGRRQKRRAGPIQRGCQPHTTTQGTRTAAMSFLKGGTA